MWETIITTLSEFFASGEIWAVIIKVLITALFTAGLGFVGTCIGKLIAKNKESKIYRYAEVCVRAAEQKFPNEGKKMGPEKMAYVMDQLAIKFPKIKENSYLYNIAEAAVRELNKELEKEIAVKEFEDKYGEKPLAVLEEKALYEELIEDESKKETSNIKPESSDTADVVKNVAKEDINSELKDTSKKNVQTKIRSF